MSSVNEMNSSDVLVMRVESSTEKSIVEDYCYFDQTEQEYLLCGSLYKRHDDSCTKNETSKYKFYCRTLESLVSMLTSVIHSENISVQLLNYNNLFIENEELCYDLFNEKYKLRTVIREADSKIVENPTILTNHHFNCGCNDVDVVINRYAKLLENVRW